MLSMQRYLPVILHKAENNERHVKTLMNVQNEMSSSLTDMRQDMARLQEAYEKHTGETGAPLASAKVSEPEVTENLKTEEAKAVLARMMWFDKDATAEERSDPLSVSVMIT